MDTTGAAQLANTRARVLARQSAWLEDILERAPPYFYPEEALLPEITAKIVDNGYRYKESHYRYDFDVSPSSSARKALVPGDIILVALVMVLIGLMSILCLRL